MDAQAGDTIVVDARQTGQLPREGEILEVIERTGSVCYRVRWVDAHESIYFPPPTPTSSHANDLAPDTNIENADRPG